MKKEIFQRVYALERKAKQENLTPERRHELRLNEALPLFNKLDKWMAKTCKNNLPKSALGKAIGYCIPRWGNLLNYLKDDHLEIDINLAENAIEPIAVCRKNHLFAGSSKNGEIAAMFYSFFATCEENQVHPFQWFKLPQNR